ncbi:MAG TPA: glucose 1-dehydrogenase, partial [Crenalkalicoccus sp.]|nr:glucose 1-dehydrogenase [Crenalkalicoccus sp.]
APFRPACPPAPRRPRAPRPGAQWTGIVTRIAERLLETGAVEAVLTMAPDPTDRWRPVPVLVMDPRQLAAYRGMRMDEATRLRDPAGRVGERETMRLADRTALVTGAASGMGAATARLFAREGARVMLADMLEEEGRALAAAIAAEGGTALFQPLAVEEEAAWEAAMAALLGAWGRLDILVNCAGISGSKTNDLYDTALWDRIMAVNARGTFLGVKHAVAAMRGRGGGAIVNFSSISGNVGQERIHCAYNASKAAVRLLTKAVAVQEGAAGIRVNTVHPGIMPPMRTSGVTADPAFRERMLAHVPLARAGSVEEAARAVLFLASDEASYITGAELHVDGGYLAS